MRQSRFRKTKKFTVKPAILLSENCSSDFLGRPVKLKTLVTRKIAKYVMTDTDLFMQLYKHEDFQSIPQNLRNEIFDTISLNCEHSNVLSHYQDKEKLFLAWKTFFSGTKLSLKEFLGDHWSKLVFQHIIDSDGVFDVNELVLQSNEVNQVTFELYPNNNNSDAKCPFQERLCFLFELSENDWKPDLGVFLSKLPNLTHVTLNDFCDDDTVSLIGRHCHQLTYLCVTLGPESFSEQQLSDDGFADLIDSQAERERPTLKEINIANCFTSTVTAKTIINLGKVKSLEKISLMWSHFIWMDLSMKFLGKAFTENRTVKVLAVKFGFDYYESSNNFISLSKGVNLISEVFPALDEFVVVNFYELNSEEDLETLKNKFGNKIKVVNVKKCRNLKKVEEMFPLVRKLELEIYMNPQVDANLRFECLENLSINKEMFAIDFQLIHDLLSLSSHIKIFRVSAVSMANYNEEKFIRLFTEKNHLQNLESFSLVFRTSCEITKSFLYCLLDHCKRLTKIENLLSWNLQHLELERLRESGKSAMFARRSHWSLPWRGEDGRMFEVEGQQLGGTSVVSEDLFDNF